LERSLSVLLPVRNAQVTLAATVLELLEVLPELTHHFELVIIDDGSGDATIEVADELAACYPQVSVVRHAESLGRASAIDAGLTHSKGEVIFLQDEGCTLAIDEVHKLWRAMDDHEFVVGRAGRPKASTWTGHTRHPRGFQMLLRRATTELRASLADQAMLLAELSRQGCPWHEVEVRDRTLRRDQAAEWPQPSIAGQGASGRAAGQGESSAETSGKPRQPNYLAKLRDFALGE